MSRSTTPTDVVESYLLGVVADPDSHQVSFTFRTPHGEREFSLCAYGVDHLTMNEFSHQNIVHDVYMLGAASDSQRVRDLLANLLFDRAGAADVVEPTFQVKLEECATAVLSGRKVLLEIEPVYGASVLLLAGSIEWLDKADLVAQREE